MRAKVRAEERERYYQLIMEYARTGLITINDAGSVYQANGEALRIFGLPRITHIQQLELPAPEAYRVLTKIRPGEKHHVSCVTETGEMSLSLGCSENDLIGFGIMAFGVGCFQGSLQALSRSYFSKIIPPENSGEYFGIYDIFAKGASFLGSLVIASVKLAGGTINVAVATMAIFFAVGFVFLRLADKYDAPRHENN